MSVDIKSREFASGEAKAKIQWGVDRQEVEDLLRSKYGVVGSEADLIIEEALEVRRSRVRRKAGIRLGFAMVGLAVSVTYFAIQHSTGLLRVGTGSTLMLSLGLSCLVVAVKSAGQVFTGESWGPVQ